MRDHVLDGLNGDVDLVLSFLLWDEERREGELFIGLELLLRWLKAKYFLVLLGYVDLVGNLSLGQIGDLVILLRAYSRKSRRKVQPPLILQPQVRLGTDSH